MDHCRSAEAEDKHRGKNKLRFDPCDRKRKGGRMRGKRSLLGGVCEGKSGSGEIWMDSE